MNKNQLKLFNIRNPWRAKKKSLLPKKYITRTIEKEIREYLAGDDIMVIYGSRQVGKTTLLYKIINDLLAEAVAGRDIFYFSADDGQFADYFLEPSKLLEFILTNKKKQAYVFIDEAQRISNPGVFLKNLYDYKVKDLKIFVTGSSSLEIRSKIIEYLPGRKKIFMLYPLSFREISEFKKLKTIEEKKLVWQEYLIFGGYPKVFFAQGGKAKMRELSDIYESYVKKDIAGYLNIEKPEKFNQLAKLLANQVGGLVNIDELTNTLGINRATLEKYIMILEDTFVVKKVYPYFKNPRAEIAKMSKIYFIDQGLRNIVIKRLESLAERFDQGQLAENFVFSQIEYAKEADTELNFWRTKAGAEIDFVVNRAGKLFLYEVKYNKSAAKLPAAVKSFAKKYNYEKAYLVTGRLDDSRNDLLSIWEI
mgnify:FL=1